MQTSFYSYLLRAIPTADLVEVTELFPRHQINQIFIAEIDKLIRQRPNDPEDLRDLRQMDLVSYIDAAVRRSGFQEHDRDELVQEIVTKLLVGNFFRGWRGGPIVARFKTSVRNHIATLAVRRSRYRRRSHELPEDVSARQQDTDDLVHEFRAWLRLRYGVTAQQAFDHRLAGGDSKELIGIPGIETSYKRKRPPQPALTALIASRVDTFQPVFKEATHGSTGRPEEVRGMAATAAAVHSIRHDCVQVLRSGGRIGRHLPLLASEARARAV